ncbi:MAG: hypothetical protein ACJ0GN_01095 [Candidatus Actinomarina sp.]|jgi:hypothetical protein|nr:hypothetical protein [Candidatus Actinomarina sp.]
MCVVCNVVDNPYAETLYVVSQTNSGESMMVPIYNNWFEMHTIQVLESFLINASLLGIIF